VLYVVSLLLTIDYKCSGFRSTKMAQLLQKQQLLRYPSSSSSLLLLALARQSDEASLGGQLLTAVSQSDFLRVIRRIPVLCNDTLRLN
jgi:hypothetical protein